MKAVLVINQMPKNCWECQYSDTSSGFGDWKCILLDDWIIFQDEESENRPHDCLLRPLPEKREPKEEWLNEYHRDEFADGWNACLKEIENDI